MRNLSSPCVCGNVHWIFLQTANIGKTHARIGIWRGFKNSVTIFKIFNPCFAIAGKSAFSIKRGNSDVITHESVEFCWREAWYETKENGWPFWSWSIERRFIEDCIQRFSLAMPGESSPWNSFSSIITLVKGGLSFIYVTGTLVNDSGSDGSFPDLSDRYIACLHNPRFSVGNWVILTPVPWNEPCAVVDEGLGSRLSKSPNIKIPLRKLTGQTTLSTSNCYRKI